MSDSYQAVYDAVRSRIGSCDVDRVVSDAVNSAFGGVSFAIPRIVEDLTASIWAVEEQMKRPSVLYRPELTADGSMWCALLGPNLAVGVAGFGATPAEAMAAFDAAFKSEATPAASRAALAKATGGSAE